MLVEAHRIRAGPNPGLIAIVAEKETLDDVIEYRNLARRLYEIDGINDQLMAPEELEVNNGRVCWQKKPVSPIFNKFQHRRSAENPSPI